MAQADIQTVRTTAYTHTEDDHLTYGARNALGGTLRSAIAQNEVSELPAEVPEFDLDADDNITIALTAREKKAAAAKKKSKSAKNAKAAKTARTVKNAKRAKESKQAKHAKNRKQVDRGRFSLFRRPQPRIGSAAADWSRWPVGTTFKVLSTGQVYKIDDYGWALAGRNTIDLYMASKADMNRWGVRHEQIKVLNWGDRDASLALLERRQQFKHCRRMMLALQNRHEEAAALR
jgi:3D (Asp-Asp-Asp) domain-containing protein